MFGFFKTVKRRARLIDLLMRTGLSRKLAQEISLIPNMDWMRRNINALENFNDDEYALAMMCFIVRKYLDGEPISDEVSIYTSGAIMHICSESMYMDLSPVLIEEGLNLSYEMKCMVEKSRIYE